MTIGAGAPTPNTAPAQAAQQSNADAPAVEQQDLQKLLMPDDAAKPAEQPTEKPKAEEKPAEQDAAAAEEQAAEGEQAAQQQPGTPDKVVQRLQQDLAATNRQLVQLLEKADSGQPLTQQEKHKAEQARRKLDDIRDAIGKQQFDVIDHGAMLGEALVETDQEVGSLKTEVSELKQQLQQTLAAIEQQTEATTWQQVEKEYAGVNVRDVWQKAHKDAAEIIGAENPGVRRLASKFFHERSAAAAASVAAKNTTTVPGKQPTTGKPTTSVTKGGASVSVQQGVAPVSTEQREMDAYLALVKDD
jgi:DNA repair exonuclease SbcCD ATPase subunit